MQHQAVGGSNLIQKWSFQGRTLETSQHKVRGIKPSPKDGFGKGKIWSRRHGRLWYVRHVESTLIPPDPDQPLEGHRTQCLESPMSTDMKDEAVQKRYIPIPLRMGARPMAIGTWQTNYPMSIGMQRMRIRLTAVGTWRSGDNLDTEATYSCQQKRKKCSGWGSDRWLPTLNEQTLIQRLRKTTTSGKHGKKAKVQKRPEHNRQTPVWWLCYNV